MSAKDVAELLKCAKVTLPQIRKAVHHLTKPERAALYDENNSQHKSSVGKFFEALSYEMLLTVLENSDAVVSVAAKLSDAEYVPQGKYDPDGLWYSRDGGIRFKAAGKVVAEMDLLMKTSDGVRIFGEVVTNPAGANGFRLEILAKKKLLENLYGDPVEFLLILPKDPSANNLRCLDETDAYAVIFGGDSAYLCVHSNEVMKRKLSPTKSSKRVDGKKW